MHFDGATWLVNAALSVTDSPKFCGCVWVKQATVAAGTPWVSDPDGLYLNSLNLGTSPSSGATLFTGIDSVSQDQSTNVAPVSDATWSPLIFSADYSAAISNIAIYNGDDTPGVTSPVLLTDHNIPLNGLSFWIGNDDSAFSGPLTGDMAEFQFFAGASILTGASAISTANRRLFVDGSGKPVDPAIAAAALGTQTLLFSGNAGAWTAQAAAHGFTITGALTNAATHP